MSKSIHKPITEILAEARADLNQIGNDLAEFIMDQPRMQGSLPVLILVRALERATDQIVAAIKESSR